MAKKILIGLGTLALVFLPYLALAQFPKAQMSDCCRLKHTVDVSPITYTWWAAAGCTLVAIPGGYRISETCVVSEKAAGAAQTCYSKGQQITGVNVGTADWGGICTMDTIYTATDFIFWIFLGLTVIFGVWVGFMFITAGGNPSQVEKARSMVVFLVIGIVVAIAVKLIPSLARAVIGV